jgi:hypothetical protein
MLGIGIFDWGMFGPETYCCWACARACSALSAAWFGLLGSAPLIWDLLAACISRCKLASVATRFAGIDRS